MDTRQTENLENVEREHFKESLNGKENQSEEVLEQKHIERGKGTEAAQPENKKTEE